ncbi:MAG: mechanosensitive ion channel, partial [Eubacteriales bacterium]|nr:mechanosensitive ion channel [Eubacteriales bacterium]
MRATEFIEKFLLDYGLKQETADVLSVLLSVIFVLILSILAYLIVEKLINRLIKIYIKKNSIKWDDYLIKRSVLQKTSRTIPFIIIYLSAPLFGSGSELIQRLSLSVILILLMLVISAFLDVIDDVYRNYQISRTRPIKGVLQVIKIIIYMLTALIIIANLTEQDPLVLIGGLGALAAVFSLIFKDSILGMVAGAQLSANDMLRIGDWIEMTKYGANGEVIDITLTTVKVQNFDKSFVTVPAYALISDSFKNWRGMQDFGGRRIMRSIYIDTSSIKFCDEEMLEKYKKIDLLKSYISSKEIEIEEHNKKYD